MEASVANIPLTHYAGYELVDVLLDARTFAKGVTLRSLKRPDTPTQTVLCCAVLMIDRLRCDVEVFKAMNEAGLVLDGGLVVDETFRTNDNSIYGVGDFTRLSRRHRGAQDHSRCNQYEMGVLAANRLLKRIAQGAQDVHHTVDNSHFSDTTLPSQSTLKYGGFVELIKPRIISGLIPGGLHFMSSALPSTRDNTNVLVTFNKINRSVCILRVSLDL
jgi:hypothetical protein